MLVLVSIFLHICACLAQGNEVAQETDDVIALLKCQIEELKRDFKEVKDENKVLTEKLDSVIKQNSRQDDSIEEVRKESSMLSSHCRLLPDDVCGNCSCIDDYRDYRKGMKYFCDCQRLPSKRDCLEHHQDGNRVSGVYRIHANHMKEMQVFCDQDTDNGGWTVFQRRVDGYTNFYQNWDTYKYGFGEPNRNFWLGLENIHVLGLQSIYPKGSELRIDMQRWEGAHVFAKYSHFKLDDETHNYTMHNSGYSGNFEDRLSYHNNLPFATYDRSAGEWKDCPKTVRGAWWYGKCYNSNLNGEYVWKDDPMPGKWRGIIWGQWDEGASLKYSDMKIRRLI